MPAWCSWSRPRRKLQRRSAARDCYLTRSAALRRNDLDLLALLTSERSGWLGDKADSSRRDVICIVVIVGRGRIEAPVCAVEWPPVEIPVVSRGAENLSRMKGMHLETAARIGWRIERHPRKYRCNS